MKGKKDYFRHSFNSLNDHGLMSVFTKLGLKGYARYFLLVEFLAEQEFKEKCGGKYIVHIRNLCERLHTRKDKLLSTLTQLQLNLNLSYTQSDDKLFITYPNILKYMGSYNSFNEINESRKEKKRKEKKIVEQPIVETPLLVENQDSGNWIIDFLPDDTLELLKTKKVSIKTQKAWLNKYSKKHLITEISKAAIWELDNHRKNFGGFLSGWLGRTNDIWKEAEVAKKEQEEYQEKFIEDCMRFDDDKKTGNQ